MTCFWDGILSKITLNEINEYLSRDYTYLSISPKEFITLLKEKIGKIEHYDVAIKDHSEFYCISPDMVLENREWILGYDINGINNGHDCSICDPFLSFITHIFEIQINHNYNGFMIEYKNTKNIRRIVNFSSDQGHFT